MLVNDTKSQDIVNECRVIFNCLSAESMIASRRWKFLEKITVSQNKLCIIFIIIIIIIIRYVKRQNVKRHQRTF